MDEQKRKALVAQSLQEFSRAIDNGFKDVDRVAEDTVWDALRSQPKFTAVIDRLKNQDFEE